MGDQLELLTRHILVAFSRHHCPGVLTCASTMVETFGDEKSSNEAVTSTLRKLVLHIFALLTDWLNQVGPRPDLSLLDSVYTLMHRYVIFCPKAVFLRNPSDATAPDLDCLALALDMGLATLETTESAQETQRETLRGLLTLLSTLFKGCTTSASLQPYKAQVVGALEVRGQKFVRGLTVSLALAATSLLRPALSECLHAVLGTCDVSEQGPGRRWLFAALSDPQVANRMSPETRKRVMDAFIYLLLPPASADASSKRKFKMVAIDFSRVCNREASPEDLTFGF